MFDQIRQGLFDRLPPHIAQGFLMNFQDESGLNPGINEISPIVPGSRGGYGLAQWTGPRRVALEGYAKSVGKPVDDVGVQLDFLMQELQGPERAAWEKISQTKTPGEAAAAIVQNFLRPAKQHMQRRSQEYMTGGAGSDRLAGGLSILPNRPDRLEDNAMQPEKSGGLLGGLWDKTGLDEERRAMLAMALSGMSMRPNTGLQAAAQMKMKNASDRKTRNKTIDWLQSRGRDDLARAVASGALDGRSAAQLAMAPAQDERTALMQNVDYIMENNPGMSFNDALAQARSGVTVNLPGGPVVGDAPKDMTYARNPDGSVMMEPYDLGDGRMGQRPVVIPMQGTKAAQDFTAQETQEINAIESADRMLTAINDTLNDPALGYATGGNAFLSQIPGTGAARAGSRIKQLQGQVFLKAFEALRGGGTITDEEGRQARDAMARLDTKLSDEDFTQALRELQVIARRAKLRAERRAGARANDLTDDDLLDIYGN